MITKFDATWCGNGYPLPQRWQLKKNMPQFAGPHIKAVRIAFRFEVAYVQMDSSKRVLMADGQWLPLFDFYLNSFGRVLGPQDSSCADNTKMAEAWRNACADFRMNYAPGFNVPVS